MYNNQSIYQNLMTILKKEINGMVLTPEQFSELLQHHQWSIANTDYSYFEKNQVITDSLRSLKDSVTVSLTGGVGNFITAITGQGKEYWHCIGANHSILNYSRIKIDIVSDIEYAEISSSDLLQPTTTFASGKISGNSIYVLPSSISSINFLYLKKPADPYYDYYINNNDEIIYLLPGTSHTLTAGEVYYDKDDGTERTSGDTITSGENKSVELFLPEGERPRVLYLMLQTFGISLNDQMAIQYGMSKEQKEELQ
jgi:hypothetical protein